MGKSVSRNLLRYGGLDSLRVMPGVIGQYASFARTLIKGTLSRDDMRSTVLSLSETLSDYVFMYSPKGFAANRRFRGQGT